MLFTILSFSLVLRSAFNYKQSHMFMTGTEKTNSILKKIIGHDTFSFVSKSKQYAPRLLVYYDDHADVTYKFLHYNFTMFDTSWDSDEISLEEKVCIFKDLCKWLNAHNQTLQGEFDEEEDFLAWNIASYIDGNSDDN